MRIAHGVVSGVVASLWIAMLHASAQAQWVVPELEDVPVERLIANVQRKIEAEPSNVQWRYTLARLYSMVYAQRVAVASTPTAIADWDRAGDFPPGLPYFVPDWEPWRGKSYWGKPTTPTLTEDQAWHYLELAIANYQEALRLNPKTSDAQMGLAWCYEQHGPRQQAIDAYRRAFNLAWAEEREGIFGASITEEAGQALLRLLPRMNEYAAEREAVHRRLGELERVPRAMTPILLPLAAAVELRDLINTQPSGGVMFDLIGGGRPQRWQWLTAKAGWLVWDPEHTGRVTDGRQLFGSSTWWIFWGNGYQPLSLLDDNGDGVLTGAELDGLAIWRDHNVNGVSEPGEVQPLAAWTIVALACQPTDRQGTTLSHPAGAVFADGTTRPTYDWLPREVRLPVPQRLRPLEPMTRTAPPRPRHPVELPVKGL